MLLIDAALVVTCLFMAYLIRFEFLIPASYLRNFVNILPYLVSVKLLSFAFFRLYKGMWRYTSLVDMLNVAKASS